jgi:bifunctional oligoribonuclease and PAP phosphatase NrnA
VLSVTVAADKITAEHAHDLRRAAELLAGASKVTLLGHVNPDADAFGSSIGLATALRTMGSQVLVSFADPAAEVPESLRHLDPDGLYVPAAEVPLAPSLLVALDTSDLGRLGRLAGRVAATRETGGAVLVIDHHASNTYFGTHHLVDPKAEATAAIVLRLLDELGTRLTERIGRALYAGLLTDTSSFRRATPNTHLAAARLLATGVDAAAVARPLLDAHPFGYLRMLSTVLGRAELDPAGAHGLGVVRTVVFRDDAVGLRQEETESVINVVRATAEAEVAVVLKQVTDEEWTGSLRAVGRVDVSAAAVALGGGGHRFAAGFTVHGPVDEVVARVRAAVDNAPLV